MYIPTDKQRPVWADRLITSLGSGHWHLPLQHHSSVETVFKVSAFRNEQQWNEMVNSGELHWRRRSERNAAGALCRANWQRPTPNRVPLRVHHPVSRSGKGLSQAQQTATALNEVKNISAISVLVSVKSEFLWCAKYSLYLFFLHKKKRSFWTVFFRMSAPPFGCNLIRSPNAGGRTLLENWVEVSLFLF